MEINLCVNKSQTPHFNGWEDWGWERWTNLFLSCFSVKQQFSVGLGAPGGPPNPFRGPKGHTGVHKNTKTLFVIFILILSWVYRIAVNF